MGNRGTLLLLVLVLFSALVASVGAYGYEEEKSEQRTQGEKWFLLRQLHNVVKTDAGSMKMVKGGYRAGSFLHSPMHIGFISMEPNSLFIPQYLDSDLVIFVHHELDHIYRDELAERSLKQGDVYTIPAGSAFYLENRNENQRLRIICSIAELKTFLTRQTSGPIVHLSGSHDTNIWTNFIAQECHKKLAHLKRIVNSVEEANPKEKESTWSLRKFLCTLLSRKGFPDFKNEYGWSKNVDESDYSPLQISGNGVYLVNLSSGSMMAPHVNPRAIEYGVVLKGTGRIQIVYPNGTLAMNARVREGDVFWVPRYFPFCQIASTNGHFEFFGFTTSARRNHQQFLVGKNSLMQRLRGPEFAAAFGIGEKRLKRITNAQHEQVILPSSSPTPGDKAIYEF
ncbi:hypothetical protein R3W88_018233 [Solanum pinnatisectum]|uniref:Cupin type-1 domain-containing protein n=1 Tax=Solanum pinnatisectum TaxID=50273 RepID=A0AAV9L4R4_9SOLN|nr:hypothetical protein R3W88_018233 [Solanum pinnatisectum]